MNKLRVTDYGLRGKRLTSMIKFLLCLLFPAVLSAQTILTLEESVERAKKSSPSMKKAELQLKQTWFAQESARLQFWSTLDLRATTPNLRKDITQVSDPNTGKINFVEQNYISYNTELTLNQPIIWTDANLSLVGGLSQYKQSGTTSNQTSETNYLSDLRLRLTQPLFTYNRRAFGLERAELELEMSKKQYLTTQQDVLYRVKEAWFNWYRATQTVSIAESELEQTRQSWELANRKYESGIIAEVDKLKLEVDYATSQNNVLQQKTNALRAENQVKLLLGIPLDERVLLPDGFETKFVSIPKEKILPVAFKNRPELENAARQVRMQEMSVEQTDAQREIRADLSLEFGLTRQDPKLAQVWNDPNRAQQVSLSLTIPIWDWGQNSAATESQIASLNSQKIDQEEASRLLTNEINQLTESYLQAQGRLTILEKTVELAQKSYDISYQKFRSGSLSSEELAQAQRRLTDSKINFLSARMDYQLSIAALSKACLYDWENDREVGETLPNFED